MSRGVSVAGVEVAMATGTQVYVPSGWVRAVEGERDDLRAISSRDDASQILILSRKYIDP